MKSLLFFLGLSSSLAFANTGMKYSYTVRVSATQPSCQEEAAQIQRTISQVPSVQGATVTCRFPATISEGNATYQVYSLDVAYSASAHIRYQASFEVDLIQMPPLTPFPAHTSYRECLADLENQKQIFERETGLKALLSACNDNGFTSDPLYSVTIEGLGQARKKLNYLDIGLASTDDLELFSQVEQMVHNTGVQIVQKFDRLQFYYSAQPVYVQRLSPLYFGNSNECESQLEEAKAILHRSGNNVVLAQCRGPLDAQKMWVFGVGGKSSAAPYGYQTGKFVSFAECRFERERFLATSNASVYGYICAPEILNRRRYVGQVYRY